MLVLLHFHSSGKKSVLCPLFKKQHVLQLQGILVHWGSRQSRNWYLPRGSQWNLHLSFIPTSKPDIYSNKCIALQTHFQLSCFLKMLLFRTRLHQTVKFTFVCVGGGSDIIRRWRCLRRQNKPSTDCGFSIKRTEELSLSLLWCSLYGSLRLRTGSLCVSQQRLTQLCVSHSWPRG